MQPLQWAGAAVNAFLPLHGDPTIPEGADDFVLWALPVAKFFFNVSASAVVGSLILACIALRPGSREYGRALNFAGGSAVIWTLASVAGSVLNYLDAWGEPLTFTEGFGQRLGLFLTSVGLGQTSLTTTAMVAVVTMLCFAVRHIGLVALTATAAIAALVPLTLNGHPNYGEGHEAGILAFALHIISAAVWLGGLITIVVLRPVLEQAQLRLVIKRYSTVALLAFAVLTFSGFLRFLATVGSAENFLSPFGFLVLVKITAAVALGLVGLVQRRWVLARIDRDTSGRAPYFWLLVSLELIIMSVASVLAVILLRLDEPIPDDPRVDYRVLAESMADQPLPPVPGVSTFLTEMAFDPLWFTLSAAALTLYLVGLIRLRSRDVKWPLIRTASWSGGVLMLFYVTNGGLNDYQNFLLSAQILAQTALMTVIPLLLVLGRPVALLLSATNARADGEMGPGEWVRAISRSRPARLLTSTYATTALLIVSVVVFYASPLLEWAAMELLGHQWMVAYFLAVGCLFVNSVLHSSRMRQEPRFRLLLTGLIVPSMFYALLGLGIINSGYLLSADWYAAMESPWGIDPLEDQQSGGWYILGLGLIQLSILAIAVGRTSGDAENRRNRASGEAETVPAVAKAGNA
ncbi:cytochrome c oxidase assembly protein [Arthrobacter sp. 35/47]|uniref:cytochrome c oxidase assembly protein n=1 Tax=Arthrobacter sp. 35/47 TaxID=269454 RepID=UPI0004AE70B8|nr:cytochrome c oxidase assembly protein [Arthrobacter sp. 35/47]